MEKKKRKKFSCRRKFGGRREEEIYKKGAEEVVEGEEWQVEEMEDIRGSKDGKEERGREVVVGEPCKEEKPVVESQTGNISAGGKGQVVARW